MSLLRAAVLASTAMLAWAQHGSYYWDLVDGACAKNLPRAPGSQYGRLVTCFKDAHDYFTSRCLPLYQQQEEYRVCQRNDVNSQLFKGWWGLSFGWHNAVYECVGDLLAGNGRRKRGAGWGSGGSSRRQWGSQQSRGWSSVRQQQPRLSLQDFERQRDDVRFFCTTEVNDRMGACLAIASEGPDACAPLIQCATEPRIARLQQIKKDAIEVAKDELQRCANKPGRRNRFW